MKKCKHCGRPVTLDGATYWVHADTDRVTCEPGSETCAEPS